MTDVTQGQDVGAAAPKEAPAAPSAAPDVDDLFPKQDVDDLFPADYKPTSQPVRNVSPIQDMIFSDPGRAHARILDAFGYGFRQDWGAGESEFSEANDYLRKAGIFNDYSKGQRSIIKAANEAIMRPAIAAIATAQSAFSGLFAGGQAAVAQTGEEYGFPNLAREIAALPEAFPTGVHEFAGIPHLPEPIAQARELNVIGSGEGGYFGTAPVTAEAPATAAEAAKVQDVAKPEGLPGHDAEAGPSPVASAVAAPEATTPDIHAVARSLAPQTFQEFDALTQKKDTFRRWIDELREVRDDNATKSAPHADAIADLDAQIAAQQEKKGGHGKLQSLVAKRDDLNAEREAYIADQTRGDSADMAKIRAQLMEADYRQRDLAADVTKAYRDAEARMPQAEATEMDSNAGDMQRLRQQSQPKTAAPDSAPSQLLSGVPSEEKPGIAEEASAVRNGKKEGAGESLREDLQTAGTPAVAKLPSVRETESGDASRGLQPPAERGMALQGVPLAGTHADIASDVANKLKAAGRPEEEARASAAIVAAYWETRAQRFEGAKGTAAEMYASAAPEIVLGKDKGKQASRELEMAQTATRQGRIRLKDFPFLHDGNATITLLKKADASTFIHETGHEWLGRMLSDAEDPAAPQALKTDAETVLKWLKVDSPDGVKTSHHEKFARGFETYMLEGRAPSQGLARVFAQFRDWLTTIYRTVAALKAPISDDIRGVFDRLLAEKPEKTVIAPEREIKGGLGEKHEALIEPTAPARAHEVANTIEAERDSQADQTLVKAADHDTRLTDTGAEAEGRAPRGAQPASDADASRPLGAGSEEPGGPGAVGAGGSEAAPESARAREKPERLNRHPLLKFIASQGGIKSTDALISDLRQSLGGNNHFIPGFGQVVRAAKQLSSAAKASGRLEPMSIDRAREAAVEAGLLPRDATITQFLDAIDDEVRGTGNVRQIDEAEIAQHEHSFLEGLNDTIRNAGGGELSDKERARALELWHKEGLHDPAEIIERLALEADDGQIESGAPERAPGIVGWDAPAPGWELSDDGRAAHGAGEGAAGASAEQPGGGTARHGGEVEEREPLTATEPFLRADTRLIDKAGNIRLENVNAPDDVLQVLRDSANRNNGFYAERRGIISDSEALSLAQALGEDPAFLDRKAIGTAYTKEEVFALEDMLIKSATNVRDAMAGTDEIAYAEAKARHLMIHDVVQAKSSAARAEAGRSLQAFAALKRIKGAQDAHALQDWLKANTGKTLYQAQQEMKFGSKLPTPTAVSKFLNDSKKSGFHDAIVYYYVNALISGPITHARYSVGNAINAIWKPLVELPTAATIGALKEAAGIESRDRVYYGEAAAQLYAITKGSRDGLTAAIKAFQDGVSPALPGERVSAHFAEYSQPIPGVIGNTIGYPGRSVAAIHSFFKQLRYEQEVQSLAYRKAMAENLSGDDFNGRVAQLTTSPTPEMMEDSTRESLKELFMAPTDYHSAMGSLTRAVNSNLLAKIIIPFMKIGSQITRNAFIERTPLGLASKGVRDVFSEGGASADMQAAKMVTGVSLMGATVLMAAEGMATGDGPTDPKARAVWLLNHRPNSISIGGVTMPYQGLGHLGMLMRFSANMYETGHYWDHEDGSKLAVSLFEGLTKSVIDENFLRGVKDMLDAVYHPAEYGASYLRNNVTAWIPWSVGLSQIAHEIDPYQREAHTIFEAARAKIPFVSQGLFPRRDRFGEPIPNGPGLPQYQYDPVVQTLEKLNTGISPVPKKIRGVELTEQQYDDFSRLAGRMTKMRLNAFVNTPGVAQMPDQMKRDKIREIVESARETARGMLLMQNSQIVTDATKKKIAPLQKASAQ